MSAVLSVALLVSSGVPVYASETGNSDVTLQVETGEEPSIVSVKVPTEIPLKMDKEGVVTVPQDLKITNLSDSTDVELTGLSVIGKDSWVVKDYSEDISSKSEGTKELSMSFRGDGTTSTGDVSLTEDSWVVNRSSELLLNVSAKLPKQGSEYKEKGSIAQVNYTFSVKDESTDPVEQFTVNYVAGENGSVNESSRSFSKGSSLTFPTTTPSEGYVFDKWVDSSTELEVTGSTTVNANMTVKALFKLDDSGEPIESTISNDWSKDKVIKDSTTPVTFSYDSTSPDTRIVSVESDNTAITVEKAVDTYSLGNSGSEIWNVKAVGKGSATVTATLNTGETTQFVVKVYELNVDDSEDVTIEVPDLQDKGPGDNINTGDIVIDIPITTSDGDDIITVTPEIPEDTPPLEEGENNINASVTIDNITINITIVINIEGSGSDNPSDGLHQTVQEAQATGFTFSSYEDGLVITSFENKQFKSEINVPEQIGDFKVLKIGDNAFKDESNLTNITLPATIKEIGESAFSGCTNLSELKVYKDVVVHRKAFENCSKLDIYFYGKASGNTGGFENVLYALVEDDYYNNLVAGYIRDCYVHILSDVKSIHISNETSLDAWLWYDILSNSKEVYIGDTILSYNNAYIKSVSNVTCSGYNPDKSTLYFDGMVVVTEKGPLEASNYSYSSYYTVDNSKDHTNTNHELIVNVDVDEEIYGKVLDVYIQLDTNSMSKYTDMAHDIQNSSSSDCIVIHINSNEVKNTCYVYTREGFTIDQTRRWCNTCTEE